MVDYQFKYCHKCGNAMIYSYTSYMWECPCCDATLATSDAVVLPVNLKGENDTLRTRIQELEKQLAEKEKESLRFYHADGTYTTCKTKSFVIKMRKAAARELDRLEKAEATNKMFREALERTECGCFDNAVCFRCKALKESE